MDAIILIVAALVIGLGAHMWLVGARELQVRDLELEFPSLPPEFDGYTILHISDMHVRKLGELERRLMEAIGSKPVDTCVVTGDVTACPRASDYFRRICSVIEHRDPILLVLGNSEHKPWLETSTLVDALSFDGLEILINSSFRVKRGSGSICFAGVDDPYSKLADVDKAFEGVDPSEFIVFLTHCPSTTPEAITKGADLILAGHTHGGQVRLKSSRVFWTHMKRNKRLNDGLYKPSDLARILRADAGGSMLFVSRGVGTSRIPIRFNCPPEVIYITLRRPAV